MIYIPLYYCYTNTTYEINNHQLRIKYGFYNKNIDLKSITEVNFDKEDSPLIITGVRPPAVKVKNNVFLKGEFGRILITPTDPVIFVEALHKKAPNLVVKELNEIYPYFFP
jgi:hypothetical protein